MCCKLLPIAELNKPGHRMCRNFKAGQGCTVYDDRPKACRDFECLWLTTPDLPDSLRPDRCKAIMQPAPDGRSLEITCAPDEFDDIWRKPDIQAFIWHVLRSGEEVLITDNTRMACMTSDGHRWERYEMRVVERREAVAGSRGLIFAEKVRVLQAGRLS